MAEAQAIAMCDQKMPDGTDCKSPAAHSYHWDWGTGGVCCQAHSLLLQQTADNLSRKVSIAPLGAAQPAALTRDERTLLMAAKLSAEAEADEIKARGAELYRQNVELTRQVQTLTVKNREANQLIEAADEELQTLKAKLDETLADLGNVTDELQRMQTLAAFAPGSDTQPGTING